MADFDGVDMPRTCDTVSTMRRRRNGHPDSKHQLDINVIVNAAPLVQAKAMKTKVRIYKRFLGKFIVAEQRVKWGVSTPTSKLNQTLEEGTCTSGFQLGGAKGDLPVEALLTAAREVHIPIPSMEGVLNYDAWYKISHLKRASSFTGPLSRDKEAMHFLGKLKIPAETKSHDELKAEREGQKSRGKLKAAIPAKRDRAEEASKGNGIVKAFWTVITDPGLGLEAQGPGEL